MRGVCVCDVCVVVCARVCAISWQVIYFHAHSDAHIGFVLFCSCCFWSAASFIPRFLFSLSFAQEKRGAMFAPVSAGLGARTLLSSAPAARTSLLCNPSIMSRLGWRRMAAVAPRLRDVFGASSYGSRTLSSWRTWRAFCTIMQTGAAL